MSSSFRHDARVIGVAARDLSGKLITTPTGTVLERLAEWGQHRTKRVWESKRALLLGLEGVRGGAFELSTFCFRPADHETVLQGKVLEARIYDDPNFGFPVLSVFASVGGCFWAILCRSEMYNPRNSHPVQLCAIPEGLNARSFIGLPAGQDLGLGKFCEPKVVAVNGEKAVVEEPKKDVVLTEAQLAKLRKKRLHLPGEKEHSAQFCCEKLIPQAILEAFEAGCQLGLLGVEVREHLDPQQVADWEEDLNEVMIGLVTFGEKFLDKTGPLAKFNPNLYPHHKPKYCGQKLVPQLVETLVKSLKVLGALPAEMRPLLPRDLDLAGKVSASVAGIHKFIPLLKL